LPGHGDNGPTLEVFTYERNADHPPTELHRPGFQHLAFEVDDIHAKREQILALGGRDVGKLVTLNIAGAGVLTLIYMTDPEGNILELQKWS
jgi:catechol 2,3-dioxygenase-like lactoylglutathione lyase family enzyme